jgi:hypothetical protein
LSASGNTLHDPRGPVFLLVAVPAFVFVLIKAHAASFTHDEAYSYLHYAWMDYTDIIALKNPYTNNHILNTVGMKLCSSLFGESEFALRLPNIAGFLLYVLALRGILGRLTNKALFVPALVLLVANPFLLDFFSLARGYGLAIAMITCSMNRYLLYLETKRDSAYAWAFFFAGLAFMANFGTLYFLAGLITAHNLMFLFSGSHIPSFRKWMAHNKVTFIGIMVLGLVMYEAVRRLLGLPIDFGGMAGFWNDTVVSLLVYSNYGSTGIIFDLMGWVAMLAFPGMALYWVVRLVRYRWNFIGGEANAFFVFFMLLIVFCLSELHCHLGHGMFLKDRFALYIVPLFMLSFVFLVDALGRKGRSAPFSIPFWALALVMCLHTLNSLDLKSFIIWKYDQDDARIITLLQEEKERKQLRQVQLGITWIYEPVLNFYRKQMKLDWLKELNREGTKPDDDFQCITEADTIQVPHYKGDLIVHAFPESATLFLDARRASDTLRPE